MTQPAPTSAAPRPRVASPCVGVCRIDQTTGYCVGCARTGDEIARWGSAGQAERDAVWAALPARFDALGVVARRTPWEREETLDFVERTLREASGVWVLGFVGAVGEFMRAASEPLELRRGHDVIEAATPRAALRLRIDDDIRALQVEADGRKGPTVLAVKSELGALPTADMPSDLGLDAASLRPERRDERLFDLGLGRDAARFCVRTGDGDLIHLLRNAAQTPWPAWLGAIGPDLVRSSPTRVIETRLGRVEIDTPIPPPGGASPPGPHTHLLPDHIALGLNAPAELCLPERYALGAVFYPAL